MYLLPSETKSAGYQCCPSTNETYESLITKLLQGGHYDLSANQAISYATMCSPVATAVDIISSKLSQLQPLAYDKKEKQFVNHPIDILMQNPSVNFHSINEFLEAYASFYIITGNNFLAVNSITKDSKPQTLQIYPPASVNPYISINGFVERYDVYFLNTPIRYEAEFDTKQGRYRYFYKLPNGATSELFHSKLFNPYSYNFGVYGKSPLTEIYLEIEQLIASNRHNLSMLKRGATMSGIFKNTDNNNSSEQLDRLRDQIRECYSGEFNAGRPMLLSGIDFTPNTQTNKDMDFMALKKETKELIYNRLHIPLAYVNSDRMIMANLEASSLGVYDNAIFPLADRIFSELTSFLMPRYENSENIKLKYDESAISALSPRRMEELKDRESLNIYTKNQLRDMDGATTGLVGGANLYGNSTLVPIATDPTDETKKLEDQQNTNDDADKTKLAASAYRALLEAQKDGKGNEVFTKEEIDKNVAIYIAN